VSIAEGLLPRVSHNMDVHDDAGCVPPSLKDSWVLLPAAKNTAPAKVAGPTAKPPPAPPAAVTVSHTKCRPSPERLSQSATVYPGSGDVPASSPAVGRARISAQSFARLGASLVSPTRKSPSPRPQQHSTELVQQVISRMNIAEAKIESVTSELREAKVEISR
jgi:hypothetical protein